MLGSGKKRSRICTEAGDTQLKYATTNYSFKNSAICPITSALDVSMRRVTISNVSMADVILRRHCGCPKPQETCGRQQHGVRLRLEIIQLRTSVSFFLQPSKCNLQAHGNAHPS